MARPTIFSAEILIQTQSYIDSCVDDLKEKVVKIPTLEGLAVYLHINKDTVQEWRKVHDEFSVLISELLHIQGDRLLNNGLAGTYNSTIAKVLLSKHGYREATDSDITSGGEKLQGVVILPKKNDSPLETTTETGISS